MTTINTLHGFIELLKKNQTIRIGSDTYTITSDIDRDIDHHGCRWAFSVKYGDTIYCNMNGDVSMSKNSITFNITDGKIVIVN